MKSRKWFPRNREFCFIPLRFAALKSHANLEAERKILRIAGVKPIIDVR